MSEQPTTPPPAEPPPATAPAYGQAGGQPPTQYAPTWGPPGKPRSIGVSILLAVVTFGIYAWYWTWVTHDEVKRHCGQGVGGPVGFLIYFVVGPVTFFLLPSEIDKMHQMAGRPSPLTWKLGFWFLLPLIGWIIWFVKVQGSLNEYWESLGATR